MASLDEHLSFLRDEIRFPKGNRREISEPKYQFSGPEYNHIVEMLALLNASAGNSEGAMKMYSEDEYMDIVANGQVKNTFYTIYKNGRLYRLYLGKTLIMKKREGEENITMGGVFPLVFPIIFP